jgi:threonine dehydrogenase-like Zn-dependent dehydrogenase
LIAVPQRNLHVVPDSLSDDIAVFTEPVAAAFQISAQITISAKDRIIVLGDGRLGNLCAQVLARISDHVIVVGNPENTVTFGISTALVSDPIDERSADVVVDCTGSETGLPTALKLVRPRGTIVLKTTVAGTQTLAWAPFVIDEVTLVGSRCGPFDQALTALEKGEVRVQPLISERYDLAKGIDALERAQAKSVLKVLLEIS